MGFIETKKKKKLGIDSNNYLMKRTEVLENINSKPAGDILPDLEALYLFDKKDITVLGALAHIHFMKKNYAKAEHFILKALDIDPEDAQSLKYRALLYDKNGNQKQYILTLEKLIKSGTQDFEVYNRYAEILENKGFIFYALEIYKLALSCDNYFKQAEFAAIGGANCYSKMGAYGIADEIYNTILLEYPDSEFAHHGKAYNYYINNNKTTAELICKTLISKYPNFQNAKNLLKLINTQKDNN